MLRIAGKARGESAKPLEQVTLTGVGRGTASVRDALGREYFHAKAAKGVRFRVGGALGRHTVVVKDGRKAARTLTFPVAARTEIEDDGGRFAELLQVLLATMLRFNEVGITRWNGRIYKFFVCWLRDHVHTLKGMKYFHPELQSAIDLYRQSQREDGMIWDNVHPRGPEPNGWDMRFSYGGFIRPFDDYTAEFKRIPVENDVEYLFVEGLYYTWKATGDDGWMQRSLDAAIKAINYSVTSPYRWSEEFQLLKRGFTIDTWDFQPEQDARISAEGDPTISAFGDAMVVRPGHTRFGVMFGDNTGCAASCRYLAEMLRHVGRRKEADKFSRRARDIMQRLDKLAWNGRHYIHHVAEGGVKRDLGVDLDKQVSLSNAYSLNRGLTHEQCVAIIKTYQRIKAELPPGSPGEWYTIYPPFERGFGGHNRKWQYMNGGVTPIVGGELAHGAFEHGFEEYGVDILRRLLDLAKAHRGHLHCTFTGSIPEPPPRRFVPMDISALANTDLSGQGAPGVPGWTGEGANDLHEMPVGRQTLAGVEFLIPDPATNGRRGCIGLSPKQGHSPRLEMPVGRTAGSIYILHTVSNLPEGVAGQVILEYADGSRHVQDIIRGRHVTGWWMPEACGPGAGRPTTAVAWRGKNEICSNVGVLAYGMDNPHPDRKIERIVLEGPRAGGLWLVLGVTLCDRQVYLPPSTVSFGIPDNWGAAAVVYALIEGLVGAKDEGVAFEPALLAPRWAAAGVDRAGATVTYPASGGYVAYQYRHDPKRKRLTILATGSGQTCRCHLLLPKGAAETVSVRSDGKDLDFATSTVEASRYVDFALDAASPREVAIAYK